MEKEAKVTVFITDGFDQRELGELLNLLKEVHIFIQIIDLLNQNERVTIGPEFGAYIPFSYWHNVSQIDLGLIAFLGPHEHLINLCIDPRIIKIVERSLKLGGRIWLLQEMQWVLFAADSDLLRYRNQIMSLPIKKVALIMQLWKSHTAI